MWLVFFIFAVVEACIIWFMAFREQNYVGDMEVRHDESGRTIFSLELRKNPDGFQHMKDVRFRVITDFPQE